MENEDKHWKQDFPINRGEAIQVSRRDFAKLLAVVSGGMVLGNGIIAAKTFFSEDKTIYITTDVVIDKEVSAAPNSHNKIFPTKKKRITKKKHRPKTIPRQQDLTYFNPNLEKQYLQHCATFATAGIIYKFPVYGGAVSLNKQLLYLSSLPNNNFAIRCTFVLTRLLRALVCRPPPIL